MSEDQGDVIHWKASLPPALAEFLRGGGHTLEAIRRAHCAMCQGMAAEGVSGSSQLLACNQIRCGLRDGEQFRTELLWISALLLQLIDPTRRDDAITAFNQHVNIAGCATIGLRQDAQGRPMLGFVTSTLRARIHADVVGYLTATTGAEVINFADATIGAAQDIARNHRATRVELQKQRAAALRADGLADKKIAQRLKVDPKTIRNWLGNREEG